MGISNNLAVIPSIGQTNLVSQKKTCINALPPEILEQILSNLDVKSIQQTCLVSHRWKDISVRSAFESTFAITKKLVHYLIGNLDEKSYPEQRSALRKILRSEKEDLSSLIKINSYVHEKQQIICDILKDVDKSTLYNLRGPHHYKHGPESEFFVDLINTAIIYRKIEEAAQNPRENNIYESDIVELIIKGHMAKARQSAPIIVGDNQGEIYQTFLKFIGQGKFDQAAQVIGCMNKNYIKDGFYKILYELKYNNKSDQIPHVLNIIFSKPLSEKQLVIISRVLNNFKGAEYDFDLTNKILDNSIKSMFSDKINGKSSSIKKLTKFVKLVNGMSDPIAKKEILNKIADDLISSNDFEGVIEVACKVKDDEIKTKVIRKIIDENILSENYHAIKSLASGILGRWVKSESYHLIIDDLTKNKSIERAVVMADIINDIPARMKIINIINRLLDEKNVDEAKKIAENIERDGFRWEVNKTIDNKFRYFGINCYSLIKIVDAVKDKVWQMLEFSKIDLPQAVN